jgi:hypothetical protein
LGKKSGVAWHREIASKSAVGAILPRFYRNATVRKLASAIA